MSKAPNFPQMLSELNHDAMPRHVALILDGYGRWATERHQPRLFGHKKGVFALKKAINYALETKIPLLSAWAFSTANWKRPESEVSGLMTILRHTLEKDIKEFHEKGIRLRVVGFLDDLDEKLYKTIMAAQERTKDNTALTFIIHFNYDGRKDILQAVQKLSKKVSNSEISADAITEDMISQNTLMADFPDPDLLIRTSGVIRLSNYMMWQCAFTEFVFLEKNWPDFTEEDFHGALLTFQKTARNFGQSSI